MGEGTNWFQVTYYPGSVTFVPRTFADAYFIRQLMGPLSAFLASHRIAYQNQFARFFMKATLLSYTFKPQKICVQLHSGC